MTSPADKQTLRRRMMDVRASLPDEKRRAGSLLIAHSAIRMMDALPLKPGDVVFAHVPFRDEADITPALAWCWRHGIRVAAPQALAQPNRLMLRLIRGEGDLAPGRYGIREPLPECSPLGDEEPVACVIVPGVAFDERLGRLGYGGGYYDRYFAEIRSRGMPMPYKLAVAFEEQLVAEVPVEAHDERMDAIVTERRVIRREREETRPAGTEPETTPAKE